MRRSEVYFVANALLSLLHDGHSAIGLPVTPLEKMADLPLHWSREGLLVVADTALLRKGDVIVRIGNLAELALWRI